MDIPACIAHRHKGRLTYLVEAVAGDAVITESNGVTHIAAWLYPEETAYQHNGLAIPQGQTIRVPLGIYWAANPGFMIRLDLVNDLVRQGLSIVGVYRDPNTTMQVALIHNALTPMVVLHKNDPLAFLTPLLTATS